MIDCDKSRPYTCVKELWSDAAREGLRDTFYGNGDLIEEGVRSGRMELFRVNDESWAVTEIMGKMLFIWCFQGKGSNQFVERMRVVAKANGLTQVSFFSKHKGAKRLWRRYNPKLLPTAETHFNNELQYVFEIFA